MSDTPGWIVTLDVLKFYATSYVQLHTGWIVTLDVLKCYVEDKLAERSWVE